ncbi:hypothetical protein WJX72_005631 [[Myrmecia] bisecta]|uniref:U-box domain-containing protein n=1 Tax=[Myrmecia] bisecta TaxID=41462 RepID=A0AAW1PYH9_9CHLO
MTQRLQQAVNELAEVVAVLGEDAAWAGECFEGGDLVVEMREAFEAATASSIRWLLKPKAAVGIRALLERYQFTAKDAAARAAAAALLAMEQAAEEAAQLAEAAKQRRKQKKMAKRKAAGGSRGMAFNAGLLDAAAEITGNTVVAMTAAEAPPAVLHGSAHAAGAGSSAVCDDVPSAAALPSPNTEEVPADAPPHVVDAPAHEEAVGGSSTAYPVMRASQQPSQQSVASDAAWRLSQQQRGDATADIGLDVQHGGWRMKQPRRARNSATGERPRLPSSAPQMSRASHAKQAEASAGRLEFGDVLFSGEEMEEMVCCPITQEMMTDPVVAGDGNTYEREAIELWFSSNDTLPMTNAKATSELMFPNHAMRLLIETYRSLPLPAFQ